MLRADRADRTAPRDRRDIPMNPRVLVGTIILAGIVAVMLYLNFRVGIGF
jgi:hypothetical protein